MAKTAYLVILYLSVLFSQEFVVQPYLQNATQSTIHILWETDTISPSIVEWGGQIFLSESTSGSSFSNYGNSRM